MVIHLVYKDHVNSKIIDPLCTWHFITSVKTGNKSFTIVYEKSEGNSIEHSMVKTFPKWNNLPWNKHVMYFYLVPYFTAVPLYLSV